MLAHAANLAVEALNQGNAEDEPGFTGHLALLCDSSQDRHPVGHTLNEPPGHRLVDRNQVFLFMVVSGAQNLVDQVTIAGHEDQALGVLVQPPDREDTFAVADKPLDVVFLGAVGGADDAHRLVQGNKDQIFFSARFDHLAIDLDRIPGQHLIPYSGTLAVDVDVALLNIAISLSAGTQAAFADVFVESGGITSGHRLSGCQ